MKKSFWLIYLALLALELLTATAQAPTKPQPTAAAVPPAIPDGLAKRYFKAHAESSDAQLAVTNAQKVVDAKVQAERQVIAEIQSVCGEKFTATLSASGDPACVAKSVPPNSEGKAPAPEQKGK